MSIVRVVSGSPLLISTCLKWPFFHKGHIFSNFYAFTANSTEGPAIFAVWFFLWDIVTFMKSIVWKLCWNYTLYWCIQWQALINTSQNIFIWYKSGIFTRYVYLFIHKFSIQVNILWWPMLQSTILFIQNCRGNIWKEMKQSIMLVRSRSTMLILFQVSQCYICKRPNFLPALPINFNKNPDYLMWNSESAWMIVPSSLPEEWISVFCQIISNMIVLIQLILHLYLIDTFPLVIWKG